MSERLSQSHFDLCPIQLSWSTKWDTVHMVEVRRFELLTPCMPSPRDAFRRVHRRSKALQSQRFKFISVCRGTREFRSTAEVIAEVNPLLIMQSVISGVLGQRRRHSTRRIDRPTEWEIPEIRRAGPPQALRYRSCCFIAPLRWVCWKLSGYLSPKVSIRSIPICPSQIVPRASTSG